MKKPKPNTWIAKLISSVMCSAYLIAAYSVVHNGLTPNKYLIPLLILSGIAVGCLAYANLKNTWHINWKSAVLLGLSALIAFSSVYVFSVSSSTSSFLDKIQDTEYSFENYSIVAKKDGAVGLKVSNKSIAYIQGDSNESAVINALRERTIAKPKAFNNLTGLSDSLYTSNTDMAVLRSSYLPIIKENYPSFYNDIKILDTFKVKIRASKSKKTDINKPFVLYISGIDTYGSVAKVSRSDVNIIAVINPKTHKVLLVNTPRDYYVQLHGTSGTKDKLTHAGIYGIEMSKNTMEDLYATKVNYTLRINFTSLLKTVDALGGVDVYSDKAFSVGKYNFVQGYNRLDAKQALAFSRERHSFSDGDRQRGKDQQRVIEAIIAKMSSPATLVRYPKIMKSLDGSFQTSASRSEISAILNQQANSLGKWQTESISVTGADSHNATYSMGSIQLYVMEPDVASVNNAKSKIRSYLQVPTKK